jgi:hypothetical protein
MDLVKTMRLIRDVALLPNPDRSVYPSTASGVIARYIFLSSDENGRWFIKRAVEQVEGGESDQVPPGRRRAVAAQLAAIVFDML